MWSSHFFLLFVHQNPLWEKRLQSLISVGTVALFPDPSFPDLSRPPASFLKGANTLYIFLSLFEEIGKREWEQMMNCCKNWTLVDHVPTQWKGFYLLLNSEQREHFSRKIVLQVVTCCQCVRMFEVRWWQVQIHHTDAGLYTGSVYGSKRQHSARSCKCDVDPTVPAINAECPTVRQYGIFSKSDHPKHVWAKTCKAKFTFHMNTCISWSSEQHMGKEMCRCLFIPPELKSGRHFQAA